MYNIYIVAKKDLFRKEKKEMNVIFENNTVVIKNNSTSSFSMGWVAFEDMAPLVVAEGAVGKNSAGSGKYVLFPAMIEFYAILALVLGIMI